MLFKVETREVKFYSLETVSDYVISRCRFFKGVGKGVGTFMQVLSFAVLSYRDEFRELEGISTLLVLESKRRKRFKNKVSKSEKDEIKNLKVK